MSELREKWGYETLQFDIHSTRSAIRFCPELGPCMVRIRAKMREPNLS